MLAPPGGSALSPTGNPGGFVNSAVSCSAYAEVRA